MVSNIPMKKIQSILDVSPALKADIRHLWIESNLTIERIAEVASPTLRASRHPIPIEIVREILGLGLDRGPKN